MSNNQDIAVLPKKGNIKNYVDKIGQNRRNDELEQNDELQQKFEPNENDLNVENDKQETPIKVGEEVERINQIEAEKLAKLLAAKTTRKNVLPPLLKPTQKTRKTRQQTPTEVNPIEENPIEANPIEENPTEENPTGTPQTFGEENPYTDTDIGIDSEDIRLQEFPEKPTLTQEVETRLPYSVDNTSTNNTSSPTNTYKIKIFDEEQNETSTAIKPPTVFINVKTPYKSVTQSTGSSVTSPAGISPVLVKVTTKLKISYKFNKMQLN